MSTCPTKASTIFFLVLEIIFPKNIDDSLGRNYSETEVLKCVNIGLWCLQQNPMDPPTMSDVMMTLNDVDTSSLPAAARPTFFLDASSGYSYTSGTISHPSAR